MIIKENFSSDIAISNAIGIAFLLDTNKVIDDIIRYLELHYEYVDIDFTSKKLSVSNELHNEFIDRLNSTLSNIYPNIKATKCDYDDIYDSYVFVIFESSDNFIFNSDFVVSVYDILVNHTYVDVNVSFDFSYSYEDGYDEYEYWGAKFSRPAYEIVEEMYDEVVDMSIIDIMWVEDLENNIIYEK
jgi:hypothetical protein